MISAARIEVDFRLRENLSTCLLIRRASRATFPDMGRLTDSPLPTIVVKTTKQFCFYFLYRLLYCYTYYTAIPSC